MSSKEAYLNVMRWPDGTAELSIVCEGPAELTSALRKLMRKRRFAEVAPVLAQLERDASGSMLQ